MRWSVGITTVPSRRDDLLPRTVRSLAAAGFDSPRLFVDGAKDAVDFNHPDVFRLEATCRWPVIHTHGNWVLALYELLLRDPNHDRYALFQDDVVAVKNLRRWLDGQAMPDKGYWNLYTHPENQELAEPGWFRSNQLGKGLQGLVFSHQAVVEFLAHPTFIARSQSTLVDGKGEPKWWRNVDGGVSGTFRCAGWTEWCHSPSLLQHVGDSSSMGNRLGHRAPSFPGEDYDACSLAMPSRQPLA